MTRAVLPNPSARAIGFSPSTLTELSVIGCELRRSTGEVMTMTQTQGQTPPTPDDNSEDIASLTSQQPTSPQLPNFQWCPLAAIAAACFLMYQHVMELEALFEDHGVCSEIITGSHLNGCSTDIVPWLNRHHQPYSCSTGKKASISCLISLLPTIPTSHQRVCASNSCPYTHLVWQRL